MNVKFLDCLVFRKRKKKQKNGFPHTPSLKLHICITGILTKASTLSTLLRTCICGATWWMDLQCAYFFLAACSRCTVSQKNVPSGGCVLMSKLGLFSTHSVVEHYLKAYIVLRVCVCPCTDCLSIYYWDVQHPR